MSQYDFSFESQYSLERSASIDKRFAYNITHYSNNKVTGIVWMTSYTRDNFELYGKYLSIDEMRSSICNAKKFCNITLVVLNEFGKIYIFCEEFFITETRGAHAFILEYLFQMSTSRNKKNVYTIFADEFMNKTNLESIGMHIIQIFYDHFHLKLNLD